ncbi:unnamed protein product [Penicillium roqueforti FM164]|uniref:Genomic scaffold, ProqFM164S02 n=1 Tax=Penicillium roqueforti (strain FM164) TaxID=1365484 RepID=W6QAC5_PENRF|nr:unnamed protein product [Penicillium roqueforti FM164]
MVIYGCHEAVHGLGRREDGTTSPPAIFSHTSFLLEHHRVEILGFVS